MVVVVDQAGSDRLERRSVVRKQTDKQADGQNEQL